MTKYQKRISEPLLDRIDIHIQVPRVDYEKLSDSRLGETSALALPGCFQAPAHAIKKKWAANGHRLQR